MINTASCPHCGKPINIVKAPAPAMKTTDDESAELKLVTCNRCGEENLCWQKSKNDKFYLCRSRIEGDKIMPLRKEFHVCRS